MIQLCQNYGKEKRLLWFSGECGCFTQAEKEKYKWMCEKDLTSAGRKGKMLNLSLDHSNSVCISVNVKYTGPQTPRFFKNQLPAVRHKPKLLVPELYPHKHWWKSADPCHLAAHRSTGILMGLRGMKFDWNYIKKKTLFKQESLNLPGGVSKGPQPVGKKSEFTSASEKARQWKDPVWSSATLRTNSKIDGFKGQLENTVT